VIKSGMSAIPPIAKRRAWCCAAGWRSGTWPGCILGALGAMMMLGGGCGTPYTQRLEQLDGAYQRGDLSREDYMRFVHDAERWERK